MLELTFPKYIVLHDQILLGRVSYHRELVSNSKDLDLVNGGGWFDIDTKNKTILLYGNSDQFGHASIEDLLKIIQTGKIGTYTWEDRFRDYEISWSSSYELIDAKANSKILNSK